MNPGSEEVAGLNNFFAKILSLDSANSVTALTFKSLLLQQCTHIYIIN